MSLTQTDVLAMSADELETAVAYHDRLYWEQNAPEITDPLYDQLVERLRALRPDSPVLSNIGGASRSDAPNENEVDWSRLGTGDKVRHAEPMLSLGKCYTEDELTTWYGRFKGDAIASHKVDGVAMSIRYDADGTLGLTVTRGDGRVGEVITENARHVGGVPTTVDVPNLEVRGETFMPLSVFRERFAKEFANPRNLTAGALKLKDTNRTSEYGLQFFAYDAIGLDGATEHEKRQKLRELGFTPVPSEHAARGEGQNVFESMQAARDTIDFEVDGVVFKVDDVAQHAAMGATAHHPRYAIAYKYQGESGQTKLRGVEWNVSRTGTINPVALVAPIQLSGVSVSRISLHNLGIIEKLAERELSLGANEAYPLSEGATLLVTRRGGVIPHVEGVVKPASATFELPSACPSCGRPVERRDDFLVADHDATCGVRAQRQIEYFVSTADIDGIGPKLIEQLYARELVQQPADLYELAIEDLTQLDRMGEKSAQNKLDAIAARRELDLPVFVAALGISDLGLQMARVVTRTFRTLADLRAATVDALVDVDGVGEIVANKVVGGLEENREVIDRLLAHVTVHDAEEPQQTTGALTDVAFVFTGSLESMTRSEAQKKVTDQGGDTPSGVSKNVNYLVIGDADLARFNDGWRTSKLKKAEKLADEGADIRVIGETEFLSIIDQG